jgi:UDP-2,3-diacylglucosamine pyrophosphatase LpxH
MSISTRLTKVFENSRELPFDDNSRIVFFSDCHRGDNSRADNFAPNRNICMEALEYYHTRGYTYIEIGDGDDLWENRHFSTIFNAHRDVFMLLKRFYKEGRLYMIWGNHDIFKKYDYFTRKNLYEYYNPYTEMFEPFFENIKIHEGLILRYCDSPNKIFVVHGHQGDLLNDTLWPVACFLVRYVWRQLEVFGIQNPISPARNINKMHRAEDEIVRWVNSNNQFVIAGHTHKTAFAEPGSDPYFNTGSCVYNGYITCMEIQNGEISLIKWGNKQSSRGIPLITRKLIAGPAKIKDFFKPDVKL